MKRGAWIVLVGGAVAGLAAGALLWGQAATAPPPITAFPPWYPAEDTHGDPPFVDYEAHIPCAIDPAPDPDCQRVKFGLVLYRDPATGEPTSYAMSILRVGVSDEREYHEGAWHVASGTALDPDATAYRLDGVPEHLRHYWAVGDDILLILDGDGMPRVGEAGYSYTLDSIPIRTGDSR
ncbi:hypothetical protein ACH3VR_23035 [Microbacterium sp. B2969]|uniref:Uncharacterized protein n=1 Tax=Microbacterium alkaliflavum TaxID=3248839 RepID=A0ABW7QES8_9MICO